MLLYPEETCVMCDLPWKNNRVCYTGERSITERTRVLRFGNVEIRIDLSGTISLGGCHIDTGIIPLDSTIAYDTMHRILYFAALNEMIAFSLENKNVAFRHKTQTEVGSPLLFEWLRPSGELTLAVGFHDGAEHYVVLDRVTGEQLWSADTLGKLAGGAACLEGRLYMVTESSPYYVLCMEASGGDLIWWNKGSGSACGGVVCNGWYQVLTAEGTWQCFSLNDGEKRA